MMPLSCDTKSITKNAFSRCTQFEQQHFLLRFQILLISLFSIYCSNTIMPLYNKNNNSSNIQSPHWLMQGQQRTTPRPSGGLIDGRNSIDASSSSNNNNGNSAVLMAARDIQTRMLLLQGLRSNFSPPTAATYNMITPPQHHHQALVATLAGAGNYAAAAARQPSDNVLRAALLALTNIRGQQQQQQHSEIFDDASRERLAALRLARSLSRSAAAPAYTFLGAAAANNHVLLQKTMQQQAPISSFLASETNNKIMNTSPSTNQVSEHEGEIMVSSASSMLSSSTAGATSGEDTASGSDDSSSPTTTSTTRPPAARPRTKREPPSKQQDPKTKPSDSAAVETLLKDNNKDNANEVAGAIQDDDTKRVVALETLGASCLKRRMSKSPYVDASVFQDPHPMMIAACRRSRGGIAEPFPEKFYRIVLEAERDGNQDIVSFFPHGRAIGIHKPERFANELMPRYFKHGRLSSFQRQLGLYGFGRINGGRDAGGYYHELFLRGRPALAAYISRVGAPNSGGAPRKRGVKARSSVVDPDLYGMPAIQMSGQHHQQSGGRKQHQSAQSTGMN